MIKIIKKKYETLDLTRELREKIQFETMRRDTYVLAVNVLQELRILVDRFSAWKKKHSSLIT